MAEENEKVLNQGEAAEVEQPSPEKKPSFGAKVKEWFRKKIVALKRKPQQIPFIFIVIVSCIWLVWLFTFSKTASAFPIDVAGLSVFVVTLLSILIIFLFLNAFPKRKKPNIVMIVLVFVFMAAMIGMDVLYYVKVKEFIYGPRLNAAGLAKAPYAEKSLSYAVAHMILQGVSIVLFATLPLYKKLILKINTSKKIEGNEIKEKIDVEDE